MEDETIPFSFRICIAVITAWSLLYLLKIAIDLNQSLITTSAQLGAALYKSHVNIFTFNIINKRIAIDYFYLILMSSTLSLVIIKKILINQFENISIPKSLFKLCITFTTLFVLCQTYGQLRYWTLMFKSLNNLTTEQKNAKFFQNAYAAPRYYKSLVNQNLNADFITDMDTTKDPGMFLHRSLAYHLYPIDIRNVRGEHANSVVLFEKQHARKNIPEGYKTIIIFNNENILAIKDSRKLPSLTTDR